MSQPLKVTDSSLWIAELSALSPTIGRISHGGAAPVVPYWNAPTNSVLQPEALNFANDPDHSRALRAASMV
jgi:hypothetical protein